MINYENYQKVDFSFNMFIHPAIRFVPSITVAATIFVECIGLMQKYPPIFFSFLCFKFLLKQNTINQQRIYHCYL